MMKKTTVVVVILCHLVIVLQVTPLSAQEEQERDRPMVEALHDRDVLELSEPPPMGSYVSLYFPHLDWQRHPSWLTTDFRPPVIEGNSWKFVVETNIPNSTVRLSWDEVESLPSCLQAYLLDRKEGLALDIGAHQSYAFASGGKMRGHAKKACIKTQIFLHHTEHRLPASLFELDSN